MKRIYREPNRFLRWWDRQHVEYTIDPKFGIQMRMLRFRWWPAIAFLVMLGAYTLACGLALVAEAVGRGTPV